MPTYNQGGISLTASVEGLDEIVQRLEMGLYAIAAIDKTVKKFAVMAQAQAVLNVSGVQVTYSGGTFVVNRVTGKLSQSISVMYVNPLAAVVIATANYADYVERGSDAHERTIQIKPASMRKPRQRTKGPRKHSPSSGSKGTAKLIRTSRTSRTWLMPARAARPFMQAAAEKIEPLFSAEIAAVYAKHIEGA